MTEDRIIELSIVAIPYEEENQGVTKYWIIYYFLKTSELVL